MIKRFILGLIAIASLGASCDGVYTVPTAGTKPGASIQAKPLEFSAWLVFWDPLSVTDFQANVSRLKRVYPEAYTCQKSGLPARLDLVKPAELAAVVDLAHQHGVKVLGTMNNYASEVSDFDKARVQKFLHDGALMEQHVDALIRLAKEDRLDGLDVDYEALDSLDRGAFTGFVRRLAEKCHAQGLLVGIALHPKTSEPGTWGGPQAQDYEALGAAVDFAHPMTYDYHWATGGAGSIAPFGWMRQVLDFAKGKIPAEKIEMGLNGYGYYWHPQGENLTWPKFLELQAKLGKAERDDDGYELRLSPAGGEAWMPDAQTSRKKFELAQEEGVRSVALWVLGQEDPKTWVEWDKFNSH